MRCTKTFDVSLSSNYSQEVLMYPSRKRKYLRSKARKRSQRRTSNFLLHISKGDSMYFWITHFDCDAFYVGALVAAAVSISSIILLSWWSEENTRIPLPRLAPAGLISQRLYPLNIVACKRGRSESPIAFCFYFLQDILVTSMRDFSALRDWKCLQDILSCEGNGDYPM